MDRPQAASLCQVRIAQIARLEERGVIDQNIEPAEFGHDAAMDIRRAGFRVGQVAFDGDEAAAEGFDFIAELGGGVLPV